MASWYVGGTVMSRSSSASSLPDDRASASRSWIEGGKRRVSFAASFDPTDSSGRLRQVKRPRHVTNINEPGGVELRQLLSPAFYVIREAERSLPSIDYSSCECDEASSANFLVAASARSTKNLACPSLPPGRSPFFMEKTSRGLSISSDADYDSSVEEEGMLGDDEAARNVENHLAIYRQRNRNSQHERILKSLICPKFAGAEFEIDDVALQGIFYAANELFFYGKLKGRVTWDWSDHSSSKYQSKIIGTTALRKAAIGGYETLIVLSHPILKNKKYNRRLLISTFLHELIHSYLFICCGFQARRRGGHTEGFRRIARLIDRWIGPQILYLCNMEADLDDFLSAKAVKDQPSQHVLNSCNMHWPTDDAVPDRNYVPPAWHPRCTSLPYVNETGHHIHGG
ncbi:hypothetical protein DL770_009489 [Monosporascus sp. CRB-9-2]|nr:hypothetical protein DL770_009489 [Monosporascus sp. CRB-9-2]